jgi:predicted RND superfamily exporter protein
MAREADMVALTVVGILVVFLLLDLVFRRFDGGR